MHTCMHVRMQNIYMGGGMAIVMRRYEPVEGGPQLVKTDLPSLSSLDKTSYDEARNAPETGD